jgi:hypothetical protein
MHSRRLTLGLFLPLLVVAMLLSACQGLNPLAVAETPAQRYAAVKLTYDALLTPAVTLVQDEAAPVAVRRTVQQAVAASAGVYASLNAAYVDFQVARVAVQAGESPEARLTTAAAELENWIAQLDGHLTALASALDRD